VEVVIYETGKVNLIELSKPAIEAVEKRGGAP